MTTAFLVLVCLCLFSAASDVNVTTTRSLISPDSDSERERSRMKNEAIKWRKMSGEILCDKLIAEFKGKTSPTQKTGGWCLMEGSQSRVWPKAANEVYGTPVAGHVPADRGLAPVIFQNIMNFERKTMRNNEIITLFDIGAGIGQYGRWLTANPEVNAHFKWTGYDGAGNIEKFTEGFVNWIDVTDPLYDTVGRDGNGVADWVMSLEVGEHIPPNSTDTFMKMLAKHARHGAVLSWALRGQGGHQHINEMDNHEVVQRMLSHGFVQNWFTEKFQEEARTNAKMWWFRKSFMVFLKEDTAATMAASATT